MSRSELIEAKELLSLLGNKDLVLIDCSFDFALPDRWEKNYLIQHIPGAYYANINQDLSDPPSPAGGNHPLPSRERFLEFLNRKGAGPNSLIVAYDNLQGDYAARLWWMVKWLGHAKVKVLEGGLDFWISREYPLESSVPPAKPGTLSLQEPLVQTISVEEVERGIAEKAFVLVDSRAEKRYLGIEEPLYKKKGHLPTALSRYYKNNLSFDQHFKPPKVLKQELAALTPASTDKKPWVFYCGSGVTACHNILAAKQAGIQDVRLYVGSFSQWIADDKRPIETSSS